MMSSMTVSMIPAEVAKCIALGQSRRRPSKDVAERRALAPKLAVTPPRLPARLAAPPKAGVHHEPIASSYEPIASSYEPIASPSQVLAQLRRGVDVEVSSPPQMRSFSAPQGRLHEVESQQDRASPRSPRP